MGLTIVISAVSDLDLIRPREATGPRPVGVPGEAVDIRGDITGNTRVFVPVPGPANLRSGLQYLVSGQPDIIQFLGRTAQLGLVSKLC